MLSVSFVFVFFIGCDGDGGFDVDGVCNGGCAGDGDFDDDGNVDGSGGVRALFDTTRALAKIWLVAWFSFDDVDVWVGFLFNCAGAIEKVFEIWLLAWFTFNDAVLWIKFLSDWTGALGKIFEIWLLAWFSFDDTGFWVGFLFNWACAVGKDFEIWRIVWYISTCSKLIGLFSFWLSIWILFTSCTFESILSYMKGLLSFLFVEFSKVGFDISFIRFYISVINY